ncbi:efflux RND transporter permease subunit [Pseudooceanicola nitratireducens]|uniref:efflux RND transporter permease subunit n=1 Tax=Pseudooceanicola nitratireducens TaxID=517719 RepID=UPI001C960A32|nr:efflux RND transporter permease subunit [Pseudooceanicola nitratireducens]MBY6158530.1 efflux RND transporter permease subunit [Pseudooceanicola nitratireducens]
MNFSAWAIRNPVPPILAFILLTLTGLMAFDRLDVQNFPDMSLPTVSISASLDGAAAAQLETEVARKIEDQLTGLDQLDNVTTTITDGSVDISVAFQVGKDVQIALDEVQSAVDQAQGDLPTEMQAPTVTQSSLNAAPLITFTVSSDRLDEAELSWFIDNTLERAMMEVAGVGEVGRLGGIDREIQVTLNPDLLNGLGLSADDVNTRLEQVQRDLSGGEAAIGGASQSVRVLAAADDIEGLRATPIPLPNGSWVRLDELGTVTDTHSDISSVAYLNGEKVIAAQIKRLTGYSDLSVTEDVRAAMQDFAAENPQVQIEEAYNTILPTEQNYEASMHMLYEGAIIAVIVVFLFLMDWRATLLAATALPLSIIPTFLVMDFMGYSLNTVTLLALSLVVGILVDDAIVEVENIERHMHMGKPAFQASIEAADEIGLAVIATTFTLIAVFLPTAFMDGITGIIFKQFGITASVAVFCSLLVARLVTPMMAAYMMKTHAKPDRGDGWIMRNYLSVVRGALRRRWIPVLGVLAFFALTLVLLGNLSTGFFPASDSSQTQVSITTAPGTTIEETDALARQTAASLEGIEHVTGIFQVTGTASTGGGGGGGGSTSSVTSATIVVNLTNIDDRDVTQTEIEATLRAAVADIPGARIEVGSGGNGTELQITLAGDDSDRLIQAASALEDDIRAHVQGIGNVTSSAAMESPEIVITPDLTRAASFGVTSQALSDAVRVATTGAYDSALSQLNLPERQVPIRVTLDTSVQASLDDIALIPVAGTDGNVTLGSIAEISIASSPSQIDRLDRSRNVSLTIELNGRNLSDVNQEVQQLEAYQTLPAGVSFVEQGDLKRQSELFSSFGSAMAIGIFCVYAVLVLLFHDFLQPLTILMALPLALGGALFPLVVTGAGFSMPAVIGLLLLMGIVSKNSILLVDYALEARRQGMARFEALVDACHKRARPILMTTIAMSAGMAPAAFSLVSGDGSFRQPMGIVVIGGLITSTFLSLLVIPVVYTFVDDFEHWIKGLFTSRAPLTDPSAE